MTTHFQMFSGGEVTETELRKEMGQIAKIIVLAESHLKIIVSTLKSVL